MSLRAVLAAIALSAVPSLVLAEAQPFKAIEPAKAWTVDVGGGGVYGFSPTGKKAEKLNFTPWADFTWGDRLYGNPLDGLGYNVVNQDAFHAGLQLRPRYSGQAQKSGLELPDTGVDAALYAFVRVPGNVSIGGRVMRDVSGQTDSVAYYGSVSNQHITPIGLLQSTAYMRGGDAKANNAYFGVDPQEAAATGLAAYHVGSGLQNAGVMFLLMTPLGDHWAVASMANAERAFGDVADSPLIQARQNREMAYRGAIIVVRRFGAR